MALNSPTPSEAEKKKLTAQIPEATPAPLPEQVVVPEAPAEAPLPTPIEAPAEAPAQVAPEAIPEQIVQAPAAPAQPAQEDPLVASVEAIMEEDLGPTFRQLPPVEQEAVRIKGHETAVEIAGLLERAKVKVRSIVKLLKRWLKLIPGLNRLFLEQEAKIKTDRILRLKKPPTP